MDDKILDCQQGDLCVPQCISHQSQCKLLISNTQPCLRHVGTNFILQNYQTAQCDCVITEIDRTFSWMENVGKNVKKKLINRKQTDRQQMFGWFHKTHSFFPFFFWRKKKQNKLLETELWRYSHDWWSHDLPFWSPIGSTPSRNVSTDSGNIWFELDTICINWPSSYN